MKFELLKFAPCKTKFPRKFERRIPAYYSVSFNGIGTSAKQFVQLDQDKLIKLDTVAWGVGRRIIMRCAKLIYNLIQLYLL